MDNKYLEKIAGLGKPLASASASQIGNGIKNKLSKMVLNNSSQGKIAYEGRKVEELGKAIKKESPARFKLIGKTINTTDPKILDTIKKAKPEDF